MGLKILSVVGARPNFMKLAPVARALDSRSGAVHMIVHTGQHYDREMSDSFFDDLGIPEPHLNLEVGSDTHAQQTAAIMQRFEPACIAERPDLVLVYGDVNSTVAAALVAAKLGIRVGHVEAGLRSGDWSMPEEVNRVVTDRLADLLFTPSRDGDENLLAEGVPADRVHFVGNVMIDTLMFALPHARRLSARASYEQAAGGYVVVTLHRPSNVDDPETLRTLFDALKEIAQRHPVVFPVHPRTRRRMAEFKIPEPSGDSVRLVAPVGYLEMLSLVEEAGLVITDSGGLQEETSFLGVPCLTVRPNTERPVTITEGTNRLAPMECEGLVEVTEAAWMSRPNEPPTIEKWDGLAAERIADIVCGL